MRIEIIYRWRRNITHLPKHTDDTYIECVEDFHIMKTNVY